MPKRRYERREPTQEWQQIRPLLKDTTQLTYEVIRPVILWGQTPKERGAETGVSPGRSTTAPICLTRRAWRLFYL